jgi:hypothetical protein
LVVADDGVGAETWEDVAIGTAKVDSTSDPAGILPDDLGEVENATIRDVRLSIVSTKHGDFIVPAVDGLRHESSIAWARLAIETVGGNVLAIRRVPVRVSQVFYPDSLDLLSVLVGAASSESSSR